MVEMILIGSSCVAFASFCGLMLVTNMYLRRTYAMKYLYKYMFKTMCDILLTRPEGPFHKRFMTRIFVLLMKVHKALRLPVD